MTEHRNRLPREVTGSPLKIFKTLLYTFLRHLQEGRCFSRGLDLMISRGPFQPPYDEPKRWTSWGLLSHELLNSTKNRKYFDSKQAHFQVGTALQEVGLGNQGSPATQAVCWAAAPADYEHLLLFSAHKGTRNRRKNSLQLTPANSYNSGGKHDDNIWSIWNSSFSSES